MGKKNTKRRRKFPIKLAKINTITPNQAKPGPKLKKSLNVIKGEPSQNLAQRLLYSKPEIILKRESLFTTLINQKAIITPPPKKKARLDKKTCWICREEVTSSSEQEEYLEIFKQLVFTPLFPTYASPSVGEWPCANCSQLVKRVAKMMKGIKELEKQVKEEVLRVRAVIKVNWSLEELTDIPNFDENVQVNTATEPDLLEEAEENYPNYFNQDNEHFEDFIEESEDVKPFLCDPLDIKEEGDEIQEESQEFVQDVEEDELPRKRKSRIIAEELVHKLAIEEDETVEEINDPPYVGDHDEDVEETQVDEKKDEEFKMAKAKSATSKNSNSKVTKKNDDTPCTCPICGKLLSSKRVLIAHTQGVHEGVRPHGCHICQKKFYRSSNLKIHLRTHRKEGTLKDGITDGLVPKGPFPCSLCDRQYVYQRSLTDHMKMTHEVVKKHVCPHCSKGYYKRREYNNHLLTHINAEDRNPVRCVLPTCGKLFPHLDAMKSHIRLVHRSKQIYNCEKCGHTCNKKNNFDRHMKSHLPLEERTKCSKCEHNFPDIQQMEEHFRRVHKGLETFKCTKCPKVFPRLQSLKSHLKIHSGVKPFSCEKCGQKFGYKSTCSIHRATVCGDNDEERKRIRDKIKQSQKKHKKREKHHRCDICDNRKFANSMRLKDHMTIYHHGPDGNIMSKKTLNNAPTLTPNIDTPTVV